MGSLVKSDQLLGETTIRNRRKSSATYRLQEEESNTVEERQHISIISDTTIDNNNMTKNTSSTESLVGSESKCCCAYEFHTADADIPSSQVKAQTLLGGLVAHTTSHGIPHINVARGVVKKSVWTFITLFMVGALIANLAIIIETYLKFKVDIVIQMQHQRELVFPAISICNVNPVKSIMLNAVPEVKNLISQDIVNISVEGHTIQDSIHPERVYPRNSFLKEEKLAEILADLDPTTQFAIGHQPKEMILDCQYSGYRCYYQQFIPFYNPLLGNCFVFNSGWQNTSVRVSVKTGRRYGLKLILNIDQDLYLQDYIDSAGVRVVIHPQSRMPFPQDEGVVISPGLLTSIGLRQLSVKREGNQYGNCTNTVDNLPSFKYTTNVTRNVFEEFFDVRYSASACYKTCFQRYLIQRCGCGDAQYPLKGEAFGGRIHKACNSSIITDDDCKYNTTKYFNNELLKCPECVLPCREIAYQPEISSVQWPSDVYEQTVLDKYSSYITSLTSEPTLTKYKRNLLKTEIYYEEFNYENIEERPSYTEGQFASDIGGVLGLWLGWSIMTVFEFIEFAIDILVLGCIKILPDKKLKQTQKTSPGGDQHLQPHQNNSSRLYDNNGQVLEEDIDANPYLALKFV